MIADDLRIDVIAELYRRHLIRDDIDARAQIIRGITRVRAR